MIDKSVSVGDEGDKSFGCLAVEFSTASLSINICAPT
jgi:hypothetical protein